MCIESAKALPPKSDRQSGSSTIVIKNLIDFPSIRHGVLLRLGAGRLLAYDGLGSESAPSQDRRLSRIDQNINCNWVTNDVKSLLRTPLTVPSLSKEVCEASKVSFRFCPRK